MHLLITGIPATGKSTFSRWLSDVHGYVLCPSTEEPGPDFFGEIARTRSQTNDAVIDWGFPVGQLPRVRELIANGVQGWWFDGDRDAAFQNFQTRAGHAADENAWHSHLGDISQRWSEIQNAFAGRILNVISTGPILMSNEDRWKIISGSAEKTMDLQM